MEKAIQIVAPEQLDDDVVADDAPDLARKEQREVMELPLLPIRNTVLIPNVAVPLLVGRDQSIKAIDEAMSGDHTLFVVTQLNE